MTVAAGRPLAGRKVLIVEDRYLIAAELADYVRDLGAEVVGPTPSVARATELISSQRVDIALLDINLDGETVFGVAELLLERAAPFVFLTGYDTDVLPPRWRDCPQLTKPVDPRALRQALVEAT